MDAIGWVGLAAICALGALLLGVMKWVAAIATRMTTAERNAEGASAIATTAMAKSEVLGSEFHNYRVEIATKVSDINARTENAINAIASAENRFAQALEDFSNRIDSVVERLDRMLDRH